MSQRLHDTRICFPAFSCIEPSDLQPPVDTIELILDAYPEGIYEKGPDELLPLHLACMHGTCVQTLELLLSRYPGAAGVSPQEWDG